MNPLLKKIDYFDLKNDIKDGAIIEISNLSDEYIFKISDILLNNEGIIILIDYGNNFLIGKSTIKSPLKSITIPCVLNSSYLFKKTS